MFLRSLHRGKTNENTSYAKKITQGLVFWPALRKFVVEYAIFVYISEMNCCSHILKTLRMLCLSSIVADETAFVLSCRFVLRKNFVSDLKVTNSLSIMLILFLASRFYVTYKCTVQFYQSQYTVGKVLQIANLSLVACGRGLPKQYFIRCTTAYVLCLWVGTKK